MKRLRWQVGRYGRDRLATAEERVLAGRVGGALWLGGAVTMALRPAVPGGRVGGPWLVAVIAAVAGVWGAALVAVVPWRRAPRRLLFHVSAALALLRAKVAALAARLATVRGWSADMVERRREAALLHDVGKIGVPDAVLLKPGPLEPDEARAMREHAALGARIVGDVLDEAQVRWIAAHHERPDGSGYPRGPTGRDPGGRRPARARRRVGRPRLASRPLPRPRDRRGAARVPRPRRAPVHGRGGRRARGAARARGPRDGRGADAPPHCRRRRAAGGRRVSPRRWVNGGSGGCGCAPPGARPR